MKVLFVSDSNAKGGAFVAFVDMLSQLHKKGIDIIVLTSEYNELNRILQKIGVKSIAVGHRTALCEVASGIRKPLSYIKRWIIYRYYELKAQRIITNSVDFSTIDLVHTNSARNSIGCYINKKYGIPHIMHIREFSDKDFNCVSFLTNYISYYNQNTTRFLAVSNAVNRHWIKKGINKDAIETVYDGVRCDDIAISTDESKKATVLKMVIVGGVVRTKGQHLAVNAITMLPDTIKSFVTLDIIGWYDNKYVNEMKKFAVRHGIAGQINFLGPRTDVHSMLGNYQIGLMCSKSEGFGLVTAEYMHAKLGVIASNTGASPELIDNEITGLVFERESIEKLAKCIERYYQDRNFLIKMSNAARAKAISKYTDEINADNIISIYKKIVNH